MVSGDGFSTARYHVDMSLLFVDRKQLQAMIHKATFLLKIRFFRFLKLLVHNQALYRPMQRQTSQNEMVPRALRGNTPGILPKVEWSRWCRTLRVPGKSSRKAQLQVVKQEARLDRSRLSAILPSGACQSCPRQRLRGAPLFGCVS